MKSSEELRRDMNKRTRDGQLKHGLWAILWISLAMLGFGKTMDHIHDLGVEEGREHSNRNWFTALDQIMK